jgi:hypothetical protein
MWWLICSAQRVPDMELPLTHPKRAFMHRLIEMEIRLAYHDRIMESLPPAMQLVEDMHAPALQPPDPLFPFESEGQYPWLRRRADADAVRQTTSTMRSPPNSWA